MSLFWSDHINWYQGAGQAFMYINQKCITGWKPAWDCKWPHPGKNYVQDYF